jgi:hypothetical protein
MYNIERYKNYGNFVFEQTAVIPEELNPRLKEYLSNQKLIDFLADALNDLPDGQEGQIQVNNDEYGILKDDKLFVKVDKSNPKDPKFYMWIMNDQFLFGDVNFDIAATLLKQAGDQGGTIGYVGNLLGSLIGLGDAGDSGTDEDTIVAVAGAMAAIAAEKSQDPMFYFSRLAETFSKKYGEDLTSFLETEFSGGSEVAALNTFRRPISPSVARGLSLPRILLDVGLTALTFGAGTILKAGVPAAAKGVAAAGATTRAAEGAAAGVRAGEAAASGVRAGEAAASGVRAGEAAGTAAKGAEAAAAGVRGAEEAIVAGDAALSGTKGVVSRLKGWAGIGKTKHVSNIEQEIKVGQQIMYKQKDKMVPHKVLAINQDGVQLQALSGPKDAFMAASDKFILEVHPNLANRILNRAGLNATKAGLILATNKINSIVGSTASTVSQPAGFFGKAGEIMGWYDTFTADAGSFAASLQDKTAKELAEMLLDLKKGTGFFGNTTNQEELAMTVIITSLSPEGARQVQSEYSKIDPEMSVYALLSDELGGEVGMFAKAYWTGITGEGTDYASAIRNIRAKLKAK